MNVSTEWVLVRAQRATKAAEVSFFGPRGKSRACIVRFNRAAIAQLSLKTGDRITVYQPSKPNGKAILGLSTHVDGVSLTGRNSTMQCAAKAFKQAIETATGKRFAVVRWAPIPAPAGSGLLCLLNPISSEYAST